MNITVSDVSFEGAKKPKLHLRRKRLKKLQAQEQNLTKSCQQLYKQCDDLNNLYEELTLPLKKISSLSVYHPDYKKVSNLWQLRFNMQYSFLNGSYNEYKNAKKAYATAAVKNFKLLKYVNTPIKVNGSIPIFSKVGRNIIKNTLLDKLRIKTADEKNLAKILKAEARTNVKRTALWGE